MVLRMAQNGTSTQLRRGVIGPCILILLSNGPRFGLQLVRELNQAGGLLTSQGTIYPLLNRLHEAGLVTSHWEVDTGERPRRYYRITEAGRAEAEAFRSDWEGFAHSVVSVLTKLTPTNEGEVR